MNRETLFEKIKRLHQSNEILTDALIELQKLTKFARNEQKRCVFTAPTGYQLVVEKDEKITLRQVNNVPYDIGEIHIIDNKITCEPKPYFLKGQCQEDNQRIINMRRILLSMLKQPASLFIEFL